MSWIDNLTAAKRTEEHFHNVERSFGIAASQAGNNWGTIDRLVPYIVTAGSGSAFGTEIKVLGSADTPIFPNTSKTFDIRRVMITNTSDVTDYVFRMIWGIGAQTVAEAEAAGQYTEIAYARPGGAAISAQIDLMFMDIPVKSQVWAKCACVTNSGTISFYVPVHEHPSPFNYD